MTKGNILTSFQTYSTQGYSKLLNLLNPKVLKDKILNQRLDTQLKDTLLYFGYSTQYKSIIHM